MAGYLFDYEQKVWGGEKIRLNPIYFRALRLYYFLKAIKDVRGKVLDVGCGTGDFVEAVNFYRPDLEVYGVDISKKAIEIARKRVTAGKFVVADAEKLPFKANFFDAIMCFDVIEHVQYPNKAIAEAKRTLKKGGIYHAYIPTEANIYTLEGMLLRLGWKAKEKYGAHPQHYTTSQVKEMFLSNKLKLIESKNGDHLFQQLLEAGYFTLLNIRGKNFGYSVEGYLGLAKPSLQVGLMKYIKNMFAVISNTESKIFSWLPGLGVHVTARK